MTLQPDDKKRVADLHNRFGQQVWAAAYRILKDTALAEDVNQETFFRLGEVLSQGLDVVNDRAFLLRVATNLAKDWGESRSRRRKTASPVSVCDIESPESSPGKMLEDQELAQQLEIAINRLREHYKDVWCRFHLQNQSRKRIAQETGRTIDSVKAILPRASALLREFLADLRPELDRHKT